MCNEIVNLTRSSDLAFNLRMKSVDKANIYVNEYVSHEEAGEGVGGTEFSRT